MPKSKDSEEIKSLIQKVQQSVDIQKEKSTELEKEIRQLRTETTLSAEDQFFFGATFAVLITFFL
jgi:hypothetical protein